jgi:hypothetical protein
MSSLLENILQMNAIFSIMSFYRCKIQTIYGFSCEVEKVLILTAEAYRGLAFAEAKRFLRYDLAMEYFCKLLGFI